MMSAGDVLAQVWQRMDRQEWEALAELLSDDLLVEYVHTGERFDRSRYIALNRDYPGTWRLEIMALVSGGASAASHVRVSDGPAVYHLAAFATVVDGRITRMTELWTDGEADVPTERRPA
jgi:hypothetical protein